MVNGRMVLPHTEKPYNDRPADNEYCQARKPNQAPPGSVCWGGSTPQRQGRVIRTIAAVVILQPFEGIKNRAHNSIHLIIGPG